jgi:hypothetical protein
MTYVSSRTSSISAISSQFSAVLNDVLIERNSIHLQDFIVARFIGFHQGMKTTFNDVGQKAPSPPGVNDFQVC